MEHLEKVQEAAHLLEYLAPTVAELLLLPIRQTVITRILEDIFGIQGDEDEFADVILHASSKQMMEVRRWAEAFKSQLPDTKLITQQECNESSKTKIRKYLVWVISFLFMASLFGVALFEVPDAQSQTMGILVGMVATSFASVVNYAFGNPLDKLLEDNGKKRSQVS